MQECPRYKATELRLLLFYTGPVVFKQFPKPEYYYSFLNIYVAMRLLCMNEMINNQEFLNYARSLFKCFGESTIQMYGPDMVYFNLHNLLHLMDDADRFGSLDNFSAYAFENYM